MVVCVTVPSCNKVWITKQFRDMSHDALGEKTDWPKTNGVEQNARRPWYGDGDPVCVQFSPHTERSKETAYSSPRYLSVLCTQQSGWKVSLVKKDKLRRTDLHSCRANPLHTSENLQIFGAKPSMSFSTVVCSMRSGDVKLTQHHRSHSCLEKFTKKCSTLRGSQLFVPGKSRKKTLIFSKVIPTV